MIFNMTAPGGSSVSGWTNVGYTTDGNDFDGSVYSDGHLCIVTCYGEFGTGSYCAEGGSLIGDIPAPMEVVFADVYYEEYNNGPYKACVVPSDDDYTGILKLVDPNTANPELPLMGFTIIYPIAS